MPQKKVCNVILCQFYKIFWKGRERCVVIERNVMETYKGSFASITVNIFFFNFCFWNYKIQCVSGLFSLSNSTILHCFIFLSLILVHVSKDQNSSFESQERFFERSKVFSNLNKPKNKQNVLRAANSVTKRIFLKSKPDFSPGTYETIFLQISSTTKLLPKIGHLHSRAKAESARNCLSNSIAGGINACVNAALVKGWPLGCNLNQFGAS